MKKRVYLAGAIKCYGDDLDKALEWRRKATTWFKENTDNFKTINPMYYYGYQNPSHKTGREVFNFYRRCVKNSDILLVNLADLEKSTGTNDEILLANMYDVPVIGFLVPNKNVYNGNEITKLIDPFKYEQIDRIEYSHDGMEKAMQYIKDYYG